MKKSIKYIYSLIFGCMLLTPIVLFPFFKNSKKIEKTQLSQMPKLIEDSKINTDFSSEFDKYVNDIFPMRAELLTVSNYIQSNLLHSPSSNVIIGSNDWLYYEKTATDYMNTNALDDRELEKIAVTLSLIQENVINNGGDFLFMPVPNKNDIYSEYMPNFYTHADKNNLDRLYTHLDSNNISYINLKEIFLDNTDKQLYHKRDTHWNYQGALLAYHSFMPILKESYPTYNCNDYHVENNWHGDLDKLLYPSYKHLDDQYYFNYTLDDYTFVYPRVAGTTEDALASFMSDKEEHDERIITEKYETTDESNLYMVRDSFGRALLPFMINAYDTATFVRTYPELTTLLPNTDMIYEIVERNLVTINETTPFMFAPERKLSNQNLSTYEADNNILIFKNEGYAYRIYGTLDSGMIDDSQRIYIKLICDNKEFIYEAFPILEKDLLDNNCCEDGFSLMLDPSTIKEGHYDAYIISGSKISPLLHSFDITN